MSEEATNNVQEVNEEVNLAPEAHENADTLSFDELDALTDDRSGEKLLSEAAKEKTEAKKNESPPKEKSSKQEIEAKPKEIEEEVEEVKKLAARYGEEDLEVAANTTFKHKIDGQEVEVELQELLNNYSGKVSYDKKFQQFSDERKEFEQEMQEYNTQIDNINKYINDLIIL